MRMTRFALLGAIALCAVASLTACTAFGYRATDSPTVIAETQTVDVAVRQYTPIPEAMTEITMLASLPSPAVPVGVDGCDRPAGCYSNRQLEEALGEAIANRNLHVDRLRSVRMLSDDVIAGRQAVAAHTTPL